MKKQLLFFLLLLSLFGYAQQSDTIGGKHVNTAWKDEVNKIFSRLDVKKIPHGLLLDRAMEFTNVPAYNGILTDSTIVDVRALSQIFKTLAMARVKDSTGIPQMKEYAQKWALERLKYNQDNKRTLILSGLYFNYARISPTALTDKKIKISDNLYEEVNEDGVWQNPYEVQQTFAVTPPIHHYNKKEFTVILPKELWLSNGGITAMAADFKDGKGFQSLPFNTPIDVKYLENKGTYQWVFRVTLANGNQLFAASYITINEPVQEPQTSGENNVFIPHGSESIIAERGAILRIDYAPNHNGQLMKPLIVAEGFDSGNITTPEVEGGDTTLADFLISIPNSNQLSNLLEFNSQQYDIIYVDWQNGTNDIKHNSRVFRNVINWVNANKVGDEPNVVLGQSMGGLIGRYTLAKMEKDGETHEVRLFIAHDAPLQGSNTPLSTQYFTRHLYDEYEDSGVLELLGEFVVPVAFELADFMSDVINLAGGNTSVATYVSPTTLLTIQDTPAAVQMNYHYVDGFSHPQKIFHQAWQQDFDEMGYPKLCRNIAISNGNECAPDHGFEARDKFISFHENSGNYFGLLQDLAYMFGSAILGAITDNYSLVLVGLLPGSSKYYYDFDIHSNPKLNATERHVYNGKIKYRKKFLWLIPITVTIMDRSKAASPGYEPFDIYSGGYFDISNVVAQIGDNLPVSITEDIYINKKFDFIPVVSALDIKRDNGAVFEADYYRRYAGGAPLANGLTTTFNNFIVGYTNGDFNNYAHISFQARNGNWLASELDENEYTENCSFICDNASISGPDTFCDSATFNVQSGADTYQWFVNSTINVNYIINNNTIVITQDANESGWVTIRVTISSNRCGTATLEKRVYVGSPTVNNIRVLGENEQIYHPSFNIGDGTNGCGDIGLALEFAPSNYSVEEIEWQKITTGIQWDRDYASYDDRYVYIYPTCNTLFEFKVRTKNECGWSDWQVLQYEIDTCNEACSNGNGNNPPTGSMAGQYYTLYPVPADTFLNVKINEIEDYSLLIQSYNIKIYELNTYDLVKDVNTNLTPHNVDVSDLTSGLYVVIVTRNGVSESFQIMIN